MKSVVIGASAGLGRALADRLASAGHHLYLLASDERDLVPLAADLHLRFGVQVYTRCVELTDVDVVDVRAHVLASLGPPDNLFYIAGASTMDSGPRDDGEVRRLIAVNFTSGVRLVNAFLDDLSRTTRANVVGAGSVAAVRGRRMNSVYGAAKSGLDSYFAAMRHYCVGKPCRVQFYRLGYLATRMTFGQRLMFPAMTADAAAAVIVANLGRDLGAVYLPAWWKPIAAVVSLLPWPVFKRLNI
jgi:short-subunit dehydrogenase